MRRMSEVVSAVAARDDGAGSQAASAAWLAAHFWVVDAARAALSLLLGVIVLTELAPSPRLTTVLFAGLGIYLIADGVLDIIAWLMTLRRRNPERARFFSGVVSGAVGAGALIAGQSMVLLILASFGLRLCLHGGQDVWRSISSHWRRLAGDAGQGERYLWLTGVWRISLGLALIALSPVLYLLAVLYVGAYLIVDGLLSLNSAAQRHGRIGYAWRSEVAQASDEAPTLDPEQPAKRRAVVFVRRSGASGLGHVGWAFEWPNGWFNAGSVENARGVPFASPDKMGFWTEQTLTPVATMLAKDPPYDEYKVFFAETPHPAAAWKTTVWISRIPYAVRGRNCADCVYDVLRSFGLERLRDVAQKNIPNEWYDSLPGLSYRVAEHPAIPLRPDATIPADERLRTIPLKPSAHAPAEAPTWRTGGGRARYELRQRFEYINEETLLILRSAYNQARRVAANRRARDRTPLPS